MIDQNKKIIVGILFGGKSAEHEVSLRSAKNVIDAIDNEKYDVVEIKIEKDGKWTGANYANIKELVDVVFPVLHGPFGEDGTIQGLLKLAEVPFVGASVLGSAVGMDKDVMKRLLRDANLPIAKFLVFRDYENIDYQNVFNELGVPLFIKPVNMGSSVGVSKAKNEQEFKDAVKKAFEYDTKIIIEKNVMGREIECSILGNENPEASVPGEVVLTTDFYCYDTKYINEDGATIEIPAKLSEEEIKKVQQVSVDTYKTLLCEGLARVDVFLTPENEVVVNEINTIPGFTSISMYPKLWEASGVSYQELIDKLIQLAFKRFEKEQKLKTSYV